LLGCTQLIAYIVEISDILKNRHTTMKKTLFLAFCIAFLLSSCNNEKIIEAQIEPASKSWVGTWERTEFHYEGTLDIISVKQDTIYFKLVAQNGGNTGEIEDFASVKNGVATYLFVDESDSCRIVFNLESDSLIVIEHIIGVCQAGNGVDFSGNYKNNKFLPKEISNNETLVSLGVLETKEQDEKFKELVGEEFYELYISSSQLTNDENEDIDSLNCQVKSSGVRGLFTIMENIIMVDKSNNIWTAVINTADEKVYYFTNTQRFKDKLPKTIEKWRENFVEKEVIYKNK
jgi:hypothetical protein